MFSQFTGAGTDGPGELHISKNALDEFTPNKQPPGAAIAATQSGRFKDEIRAAADHPRRRPETTPHIDEAVSALTLTLDGIRGVKMIGGENGKINAASASKICRPAPSGM